MEFEGTYRIKALPTMTENGIKYLSRDEIAEFGDEDYARMLRAIFFISEKSLDLKIKLTEEELKQTQEELGELTVGEDGLTVFESHEIICEDGVWKVEAGEEDGQPFYGELKRNEDGDVIYVDAIVLEKI